VLFAEHKLLYPMETRFAAPARGSLEMRRVTSPDGVCTVSLSAVPRSECVATVYAYGYQACMLEEVLERLALEEEIFLELLVPSRIAPVDYTPLFDSVQSTGRLFTVEEGTAGWSWGSEIAMAVSRALFGRLKAPVEVLTSNASLIPSSRVLEEQTLMHARRVEHTIREHFTH
jgi:acetoin:2,6-dichlorophenolindophenol oxidoreductase subunit beta